MHAKLEQVQSQTKNLSSHATKITAELVQKYNSLATYCKLLQKSESKADMDSKSPETVQSKVTSLSSADIARTKTTNTTVSTLVEITYTDNNRKAPLTKIRRCPETVQLVRELLTAKDILVVGPECEGTFSIQIPEPKNVKSIREKFSRFMIKKRSRSKD